MGLCVKCWNFETSKVGLNAAIPVNADGMMRGSDVHRMHPDHHRSEARDIMILTIVSLIKQWRQVLPRLIYKTGQGYDIRAPKISTFFPSHWRSVMHLHL